MILTSFQFASGTIALVLMVSRPGQNISEILLAGLWIDKSFLFLQEQGYMTKTEAAAVVDKRSVKPILTLAILDCYITSASWALE